MTDSELHAAVLRLLLAVDQLFSADPEWGADDLDGYMEVARAVGHVPAPGALFEGDEEQDHD